MYLNQVRISVIFVFLPYLHLSEASIKCFKCTVLPPPPLKSEPVRLCSNFDFSDHYVVDCPYSTVCMKKTFTVNFTGQVNSTARDCAAQRYEYQAYEDGKWELKTKIEEPYLEGCKLSNDKGQRSSDVTHCYCRGDLCNGSNKLGYLPTLNILAVIYIVNAIRTIVGF